VVAAVLAKKVHELRKTYGSGLDIVVLGDLNYPDQKDGRYWAPRQVFTRLGMKWVSRGLDWVAYSKSLKLEDVEFISPSENGQDHPWIEVTLRHRVRR